MALLSIVNPLAFTGWNELLLSQETSSFFHTSQWAKVLHETYKYEPLYFTRIEQGKLLTLIPLMEVASAITGKRGVSLPFSDYCEMIIDRDIDMNEVLNELITYGGQARWRSIELTDGRYLPANTVNCSFYYEHSLDLARSEKSIFSTFNENMRRNIKKAFQQDVIIHMNNTPEGMVTFYRLHCMTRKRHGLPPQPFKFFQSIYNNVIASNLGIIMVASHDAKAVASAIYCHFGTQAIFKYGASDMRYKQLRANSLVMWKAIEWLSQNGCKRLSLGRTDPDNEGLEHFKKGWGTTERIIKYYKLDLAKKAFVEKKSGIIKPHKKLLRLVPTFLLRAAGSLLYRHVG